MDRNRAKVLLIDMGGHFGGVETYLVGLASLMSSELDLYALCALPELGDRLSKCGVTVVRLPLCGGVLKPFRFLAGLFSVPLVLWKHKIQTVQVNGLLEGALMVPVWLMKRSAVYTRHGPFEIDLYSWTRHPLKYAARRIARWSVRFTTHVVCVSEAVAEGIGDLLPQNRYSVISNWVSSQKPFQAPRPVFVTRAQVLCVSRLEHYKGIHLLIEAARSLPDVDFTIVGDGGHREFLENLAVDLANVRFAGFQRNTQQFYDRADIFVMPSMGPEGLPITSLEAMANGLPCIFSDLPVHHEITSRGRGAFLFQSGAAESLLSGLRQLLGSATQRHAYAAQAHAIVAARYTAQNVREAYRRALTGQNPHPRIPPQQGMQQAATTTFP